MNQPLVSRSRVPIVLGAIVLFALALRLLFVQTFFSPDDDVYYLRDAYLLAHGTFVHNSHWALRVAVVAPTAVIIRIFGFHDWSVILYPLCLSLLGIVLMYALGKTFFNRDVGLLAAFLLACFPEHIYYSSLVMADLPGALFGSLAVFFAYVSRTASTVSRTLSLCTASGCGLVVSYLCWEVNLIFVPFCCLAVTYNNRGRHPVLSLSVIVAFVAAAIAIESLLYWGLTGDFFYRWTVVRHVESAARRNATITVHDYLLRVPKAFFNPANKQQFLYSWLVVWAVFILRRCLKQMEVQFLLLWLLTTLVFLGFGVYSLHPLRTLLEIEYSRYFDDLAYPAILLLARALYEIRPKQQIEMLRAN